MSARNEHAEQNVLGACLISDSAFWQVSDLLTEADFWDQRHRVIWDAMTSVTRSGKPLDFVTVGDDLAASGKLELAGGLSYVIDVANGTAAASNARAYAEIVSGKSIQRRVADAGAQISKLSGDNALAQAQTILGSVSDRIAGKTKSADEAMSALVKVMQEQADRTSNILGVPTPFPMLNDMTAGLQEGDLVLVAGRPSMGKSVLAVQLAEHAATLGYPSHVFTLEMPTLQCMQRLVSARSGVPFKHVRDAKKIAEEEWSPIVRASEEIKTLPLYFDDDVYELSKVLARIRQVHATKGTRVIVLDYLTFMKMPQAQTQTLAIQEITREFKAVAKALKLTFILVSQLNRQAETRGDKRPTMADLRESGAIEQDADVILMPYRDEYYDKDSYLKGYTELLIRKQRNGDTGTVPLRTRFDVQRFDSAPEGLPERPAEPVREVKRGFSKFTSRGITHAVDG